MIALANALSPEEVKNDIAPVMRKIVADKSWRVRYMIADKFVEVSTWLWYRL